MWNQLTEEKRKNVEGFGVISIMECDWSNLFEENHVGLTARRRCF